MAGASGSARLAGRGIPRERLGHEAHGETDGDVGNLSAVIESHAGNARTRSGEPNAGIAISAAAGGGIRTRQRSLHRGHFESGHRRTERVSVSARGLLREPAISEPRLLREHGRPAISARRLYALAADIFAARAGELRRAIAGRMHGDTERLEFAATGADGLERSDLRGSGADVRGPGIDERAEG